MGFIYQITNTLTGDFYIGQTKQNINRRFNNHVWNAKNKKGNNIFYNAINKYGIDKFNITLLEEVKNDMLDIKEIEYISTHNPKYNTAKGGSTTLGFLGKKLSTEHKKALDKSKEVKIYQYDLEGKFLNSFDSVQKAALYLGDVKYQKTISHCVNKKQKSSHNYIWSKTFLSNIGSLQKNTAAKKVTQCTKDGVIIKIWGSALEAEKLGGFCSSKISNCCKGKRITHSNFKWYYAEDKK